MCSHGYDISAQNVSLLSTLVMTMNRTSAVKLNKLQHRVFRREVMDTLSTPLRKHKVLRLNTAGNIDPFVISKGQCL